MYCTFTKQVNCNLPSHGHIGWSKTLFFISTTLSIFCYYCYYQFGKVVNDLIFQTCIEVVIRDNCILRSCVCRDLPEFIANAPSQFLLHRTDSKVGATFVRPNPFSSSRIDPALCNRSSSGGSWRSSARPSGSISACSRSRPTCCHSSTNPNRKLETSPKSPTIAKLHRHPPCPLTESFAQPLKLRSLTVFRMSPPVHPRQSQLAPDPRRRR